MISVEFLDVAQWPTKLGRSLQPILSGKNGLGLTDEGSLVRVTDGQTQVLGSQLLGRDEMPCAQVEGVQVYFAPNYYRNMTGWKPTEDALENINQALETQAMRDYVVGKLTRTDNEYDDGRLGRFNIIKIDNPQEMDGASYAVVEGRGLRTGVGYQGQTTVSFLDKEAQPVRDKIFYSSEAPRYSASFSAATPV
ncbi:MAG: hypothetical protein VXW91_01500 [Pseudomonadota bacterium]|nr:hypothetical protein [Pseudomonadota bacterium]